MKLSRLLSTLLILAIALALLPIAPALAAGTCEISYVNQNDWGSGATISVTIKNTSASAINGWTLTWAFSGNQRISDLWNGSYTQSGTSASVSNLSYNNLIAANGGTTSFGFNISYSGTNPSPTSFTLNGTACGGSTATSTTVPPTATSVPQTAVPTATLINPSATATQASNGQVVEAENYASRSSNAIGAVSGTDGGAAVVLAARPNEWTSYNNQNLTSASINLRYSNAYAAANVEVRAGASTGTLLGTCSLPLTGNWSTFATSTCALNGAGAASQTLTLVFTANNYVYLNWFSLSSSAPVVTNTPSLTPSSTLAKTATPTSTKTPTPIYTPTITVTPSPVGTSVIGNKKVIGYFPAWGIYGVNYHVKNIDTSGSAAKMTHINYAFINVLNNKCSLGVTARGVGDAYADYSVAYNASQSVSGVGDTYNQPLRGNFNQLKQLKAKYPGLKVMASLGGWTWSDGFYSAARPENRVAFVASCVDSLIRGNLPVYDGAGGTGAAAGVFDGIDIDWEYPGMCGLNSGCGASSADKDNFTALLAEFRKQLDAQGAVDGKKYLLSAAMPAGIDKIAKMDIPSMVNSLDYINLMTYDFFGSWSAQGPTAFQSALYAWDGMPSTSPVSSYYTDAAVKTWINSGMPASRIQLGIPFYGRGWSNVTNQNNGLNQPANGAAPGDDNLGEGMQSYKYLKALNWPSYRNTQAQANWIFNGSIFWTFDDPTTIQVKMAYIKSLGLGGAMFWELSNDTIDGELIAAIYNGLK